MIDRVSVVAGLSVTRLLRRRSVARAKHPGALRENRYCCFFAASSGLPDPLYYISLAGAGEALVEPLRIVDEQTTPAIPMSRTFAAQFVARAHEVDRFPDESRN